MGGERNLLILNDKKAESPPPSGFSGKRVDLRVLVERLRMPRLVGMPYRPQKFCQFFHIEFHLFLLGQRCQD